MRRNKLIVILSTVGILTLLLFAFIKSDAWGFYGHKRINRLAIFTLPPKMISFYKENIEYITEHAVDPDMRRYSDPEEAPRHYIDLDRYGQYPKFDLPRKWDEAVVKYSEDTLKAHGIVPWHIPIMMYRLTDAFKSKNKYKILHVSADLGHYVADAHVPLHCTRNYNGQLTGQNGIHGFWESRIPELFGDDYDYFIGKAQYIDKPAEFIWKFILESSSQSDSVLTIERELSKTFPSDKKYAYEERGANTVRVYSREYSQAYSIALNNMVERKLRSAIIDLGSIWYTCWVNAGSPSLSDLKDDAPTIEEEQEIKKMEAMWKAGKIIGREHEN